MKSRTLIAQVAALGTFGLWVVGCTTDPPRELAESEAMMTAELVGRTVVDAVEETVQAIALAGDPRGLTYEHEVDCPEGGTAALSGTVTVDEQIDDSSYSASAEGSVDFDSCAGRTDEDVVIALTGVIDFAAAIVATVSLADRVAYISVAGSAAGSLEWEIVDEGESGVCEVDVAFDVDLEFEFGGGVRTIEGDMTGTVCGHIVDVELEF